MTPPTSPGSRPRGSGSPALDAVARVRTMHEQDSLFGLNAAITDARRDRHRVDGLETRLDAVPAADPGQSGAVEDFLRVRGAALVLGRAIGEARTTADATDAVAVAARGQWVHDRQRLDAISTLMERRADLLREERRRRETRDLDEVAGQMWARKQGDR